MFLDWNVDSQPVPTSVAGCVGGLFTDEARLDAPVRGTSSFAQEFGEAGPRDPEGRSLRDLDAELAAGDVDRADYETLRDGYTKRAADVLRDIEEGKAALPASRPRRARRSGWWRCRPGAPRCRRGPPSAAR